MSNIKKFTETENKPLYYRIGINYYIIDRLPMANGSEVKRLYKWSADAIRLDHGKEALNNSTIVKKLKNFVNIPMRFDYQRVIKDYYYNRYSPLPYLPKNDGVPNVTIDFLEHIFGEQLNLGLDYITILLLYPTQVLPVLCPVSKYRGSGKSLFINWLKRIFGDNMTINTNEDFHSNFNADWADKLLIATEKTLLNRKEDSERFKNLSTAKYFKVESKGIDRVETEFFGKFILCSNNEQNFIYVDKEEIRYWVRQIPYPQKSDPNLLDKLTNEIPAFLFYLKHRTLSTTKQSRMWFTPEQIETDALKNLKSANRNKIEYELAQCFIMLLDNLQADQKEVRFIPKDALSYVKSSGIRNAESNGIIRFLQDSWGLHPENNSKAYTRWIINSDGLCHHVSSKGRYYTINRSKLIELGFLDVSDAE